MLLHMFFIFLGARSFVRITFLAESCRGRRARTSRGELQPRYSLAQVRSCRFGIWSSGVLGWMPSYEKGEYLHVIALSTLCLLHPRYVTMWYLCVFFALNRSFYPSTSRTTSVRAADSSILLLLLSEEIQVLRSVAQFCDHITRISLPEGLKNRHGHWVCDGEK